MERQRRGDIGGDSEQASVAPRTSERPARKTDPVQRPELPSMPDLGDRLRASLPPELMLELDGVGIDPTLAPSADQWRELLPRIAGLIRARSFGRDGVALSHELRTPMTVVIGATELLLETELDSKQRAVVEGVHSSGQELLNILDQVLDEPQEGAASVSGVALSGEPHLEGKVLVVEDNEFNRALIAHAMASIGCEVDTVDGGAEALQQLSVADYDVVLMDCHMSGLDGFDTAREIRARERGRRRVPIIAVTAGGVPEVRRACLAAGMDDYIAKPFTLSTLRKRVAYWIARFRNSDLPPPEAPATVPVPSREATAHLDLTRLEELAHEAGTPLIAVELTTIFLEDVVRRVRALADAASAHDQASCLSLAHAIKGACGNFGAVGMARLAEESERRSKAGAHDQVAALASRLRDELGLVRALLDEHGLIPTPGITPRPRLGRSP